MANTLPTTMEYFDNLLGKQLTDGGGSGGGGSWQTVFEDSVTTENTDDGAMCIIEYASVIDADKIKVTFNGTEYECDKITAPVGNAYGGIGPNGPDFSEYPFGILSGQSSDTIQTVVYTETAGTYTLKIEEPQSGGSSDFSTAEVTIIGHNDARGFLPPSFPYVADNNTSVTMGVQEENSHIYTVVLYKGSAWGAVQYADIIAMTGGVELSQDEKYLIITGDGTLTIKPLRDISQ